MRKLFLLLLLFFISSNLFSQSWSLKWHNGGNGWVGGWHIDNSGEQYFKFSEASSSNDKIFFQSFLSGWGSIMGFDPSLPDGWAPYWSNNGNNYIGGLKLGPFDQYEFPYSSWYGLYNGTTTDLIQIWRKKLMHTNFPHLPIHIWFTTNNGVGSASFTNGNFNNNFNTTDDFPDAWHISHDNDRYISGDYDNTNSVNQQELMSVNVTSGWATLHFMMGNNQYAIWSNLGNGWIGGWHIDTEDRFFSADRDGDHIDELICVSGSGWWGIEKYSNGTWTGGWGNGGTGWLNGWHIDTHADSYIAGDFNRDGKDDILLINNVSGWAAIKQYANGAWTDIYTNNGSNWINSWQLSTDDHYASFKWNNRIQLLCINGEIGWSMVQEFSMPKVKKEKLEGTTNNEDNLLIPNPKKLKIEVKQPQKEQGKLSSTNYPNPFNPTTKISFNLLKTEFVTLDVYNELGSKVKTLVNQSLNSGEHTFEFDGANLSSGIYYYKISTASDVITKKMLLVK